MIRRLWRDHVEQVRCIDLGEIHAVTQPSFLLFLLAWTVVANVTMGWVEPVHTFTGYHHPLVPVALMAVGLSASYLIHRATNGSTGAAFERVAVLTLVDTPLIAASVVTMGLCASHPTDYVLALLYVVTSILWGLQQGFSWPTFAAVVAWPLLLTTFFAGRDLLHVILVSMSAAFYTLPALIVRRKNRSKRDSDTAARARLAEASRLATLGRVGASLAHEMNQPLVAIRGFAQRLARNGPPGSNDELESIAHASSQLARLVERVQALGAPQPSKPEPLDPTVPVEDALLLVRAQLEHRGIAIAWASPSEPMQRVLGDRQRLGQVMVNLLVNARDALSALPEGAPRSVRIAAETVDGHVSLEVTDSGPGVPAEAEPHLFDPFFTTKDRAHGTGLGLAISHEIAEEHGGMLVFERPAKGGARFRLVLPVQGATS